MIKKIALTFVIILALLIVFRDLIIKQVIVSVGSFTVGAPLMVGGFSLGLLSHELNMTNVKLYNPPGFTNNPLIDIAHIKVHFDPMALASGKMYFSLIDLDIRQLAIERNKTNQFNVSSLKVNPQHTDKKYEPQANKPLEMRIDVLKLNVDRVTFREYDRNGQLKEMERGIGLQHKEFKKITSPAQLSALVFFEASGIGELKNIGMQAVQSVLKDVGTLGVTGDTKKTVNALLGSFLNK